MKFGSRLFIFLFAFYALLTIVYWFMTKEHAGTTALALSAGLALIIGYYFWFTNRRTGGVLPVLCVPVCRCGGDSAGPHAVAEAADRPAAESASRVRGHCPRDRTRSESHAPLNLP